jgi:hypothetical protein
MTRGKIFQSVGVDRSTFIIILEVKANGSLYRPKAQGRIKVSSTFSLNSALDRGGWLVPRPGGFTPRKGRSGWMRKISPLPVCDPRTVQTVASRHTDCAVPVHIIHAVVLFNSTCWDDSKLHENTSCSQLKHVHMVATWEPNQVSIWSVQAQAVLVCATWNQGRTQWLGGGADGLKPPKPPKLKYKNHRFCRYYGIKSFTWFPVQPKSATEIDWWLVR